MEGTAAGGLPAGAQVTLGFNRARIREAAGELAAAAADFRGILAAFPGYTDARLRLAAIARARGDLAGAATEAQVRLGLLKDPFTMSTLAVHLRVLIVNGNACVAVQQACAWLEQGEEVFLGQECGASLLRGHVGQRSCCNLPHTDCGL